MKDDQPIAIVTGGGRGIGRASARRLAEDGFHVVVIDIDGDRAERAAADIREQGLSADSAGADVRDRAAIHAILADLPRIDVAFSNAGHHVERPFLELDEDDFQRAFGVSVLGAFIVGQEAARLMRRGGRIINMSSRAFLGSSNAAPHTTAKAAVVGLTRAMAIDLLESGIAVNAIAPGFIDTEGVRERGTPETFARQVGLQPTGSAGRPEDIANAVSFLAAPGTAFLTGQVIIVDGGKALGTGIGI